MTNIKSLIGLPTQHYVANSPRTYRESSGASRRVLKRKEE